MHGRRSDGWPSLPNRLDGTKPYGSKSARGCVRELTPRLATVLRTTEMWGLPCTQDNARKGASPHRSSWRARSKERTARLASPKWHARCPEQMSTKFRSDADVDQHLTLRRESHAPTAAPEPCRLGYFVSCHAESLVASDTRESCVVWTRRRGIVECKRRGSSYTAADVAGVSPVPVQMWPG